jgi:hypothetical protein
MKEKRNVKSNGDPLVEAEELLGKLGLFLMGLCAFITLMAGYFQARKMIVPRTNSQGMDSAGNSEVYGRDHDGS